VNHAAESVATSDAELAIGSDRASESTIRRCEVRGAVRAMPVVVILELSKDAFRMRRELLVPIFGDTVQRTLQGMGIREVVTEPRSPWQNPFVERVIGSLRRECLDHVIVWNERGLRRHLQRYLAYYHVWRPPLALDKDTPFPRATQPPNADQIVAVPEVGGLHHHRERCAA
jgi:hypothetical protein